MSLMIMRLGKNIQSPPNGNRTALVITTFVKSKITLAHLKIMITFAVLKLYEGEV